jgi:two-component system cell cycle response regulator
MSKKILIVDDEKAAVDILEMLFAWHDFDVLTAKDGIDACEVIKATPPDVILSDYMMPNLDGASLCNWVKSNPETRDIPFILMSAICPAHSDAQAVFIKPIEIESVMNEIRHLLPA